MITQLSNSLEGYRVYAGLILTILGWFGIGDLISSDQVATLINAGIQIVGILYSAYWNHHNHVVIGNLKDGVVV